ncbi:MAG: hypothetical protein H7334_11465 [Ferruginibacter sp.]|nr:hypothetical protein [Ferruginibacter sp.]
MFIVPALQIVPACTGKCITPANLFNWMAALMGAAGFCLVATGSSSIAAIVN